MIDYFLGIGQGEYAAKWLAKEFPKVRFHPAPDYLRGRHDTDFDRIGRESIVRALGSDRPGTLIAESQAAPALVRAIATGAVSMPENLILVQPLGFNPIALGGTERERKKKLLSRSRMFWIHRDRSLFIVGNLTTLYTLIKQFVVHYRHLSAAYAFATSRSIAQDLTMLLPQIEISIYVASEDSLFPYEEVMAENPSLREYIVKIPGTHMNRATKKGAEALRNAEILT